MGGHKTVRASEGYEFSVKVIPGKIAVEHLTWLQERPANCVAAYVDEGDCVRLADGDAPSIPKDAIRLELVEIEEPEPPKIDGMPLPTKPSVFAWTGYRYCWLPLCDAVPGDAKCSGA